MELGLKQHHGIRWCFLPSQTAWTKAALDILSVAEGFSRLLLTLHIEASCSSSRHHPQRCRPWPSHLILRSVEHRVSKCPTQDQAGLCHSEPFGYAQSKLREESGGSRIQPDCSRRVANAHSSSVLGTQYSVLQCPFFPTHLIPRYARNDNTPFDPAVRHLLTRCSSQYDGGSLVLTMGA
jgi:hypothetical protein